MQSLKRIKLFYYGDTGENDNQSPNYAINQDFSSEVLYLLAVRDAYFYDVDRLSSQLKMDKSNLISLLETMCRIKLISQKGGFYKLEFCIFTEHDLPCFEINLREPAKQIASKIKNCSDLYNSIKALKYYDYFSDKRWLYHILCDIIFDGFALDYLENKGLFCTHKEQVGNRDYIAYGFEDSDLMASASENCLCSSNNYRTEKYVFNSFGDSAGNRNDFYRVFKRIKNGDEVQSDKLNVKALKALLSGSTEMEIADSCGRLIEFVLNRGTFDKASDEWNLEIQALISEMGYIGENSENSQWKCTVPVFIREDMGLIEELSQQIMDLIYEEITLAIQLSFESEMRLSPLNHELSRGEIGIELWHQLFGRINEELILSEIVAIPCSFKGEGRYLKSFYLL